MSLPQEIMERYRAKTGQFRRKPQYRYRRNQNLSNALEMFFSMTPDRWYSSLELADLMEWEPDNSGFRRISRIAGAYERLGYMESQRRGPRGGNITNFYRRVRK